MLYYFECRKCFLNVYCTRIYYARDRQIRKERKGWHVVNQSMSCHVVRSSHDMSVSQRCFVTRVGNVVDGGSNCGGCGSSRRGRGDGAWWLVGWCKPHASQVVSGGLFVL